MASNLEHHRTSQDANYMQSSLSFYETGIPERHSRCAKHISATIWMCGCLLCISFGRDDHYMLCRISLKKEHIYTYIWRSCTTNVLSSLRPRRFIFYNFLSFVFLSRVAFPSSMTRNGNIVLHHSPPANFVMFLLFTQLRDNASTAVCVCVCVCVHGNENVSLREANDPLRTTIENATQISHAVARSSGTETSAGSMSVLVTNAIYIKPPRRPSTVFARRCGTRVPCWTSNDGLKKGKKEKTSASQ